ncbi:MAG: hypothetical protein CL691_06605 [Cellvibrionales bacterium]|nr:hypothetical protein [Cellvibrionales bacterium]|tara:strand:+ start:15382 stop:15723 length:342 start_codon:yes stop_codon:yes gene_type:complete
MAESIYKVIFLNQNQVYEVYAKHVYQSDMYGFIEIEAFVFGERSQMIVDPAEERLKNEFSSVSRSYIPMHALIRIDEVEKEGVAKISDAQGANVTQINMSRPLSPRDHSGDSD